MNHKNTKRNIYLPLLLSVFLVGGILIGLQFNKNQTGRSISIHPRLDKLHSILKSARNISATNLSFFVEIFCVFISDFINIFPVLEIDRTKYYRKPIFNLILSEIYLQHLNFFPKSFVKLHKSLLL